MKNQNSPQKKTPNASLVRKGNKNTKKEFKRGKVKKSKTSVGSVTSEKFILDTTGGKVEKSVYKKMSVGIKRGTRRSRYKKLEKKERELATDLFGDDAEVLGNTPQESWSSTPQESAASRKTSDKSPTNHESDEPSDISSPTENTKKPAWIDEDDDNIRVKDVVANMAKARGQRGIRETSDERYEAILREKYKQIVSSTPEWAELDKNTKDDSDDEVGMTRSTGDYLSKEPSVDLPKTTLEYKDLPHVNNKSRCEGAVIKAVEFNPHFPVGLVAGFSHNSYGAATLFQVDGAHNHKIQSVAFPKFPVKCAKFLQDGRRFVVGSNLYGHLFVYDMEAAKEIRVPCETEERRSMKNFVVSPDGELIVILGAKGLLYLFDTTALSIIDVMHAPAEVTGATFNHDGSRMYTHGIGGDVCVWDMDSRACVHRFYDDGCIDGTSIALSPNNQYLACGSSSGIVNVYDIASVSNNVPKPVKVLDHLVTSVSALAFNSSSEILAMASELTDNAFKMVHFPSMTYFTNFPRQKTNLRRVQVLSFSPQSGFLTAGNNFGAAYLYRLKHFSSY